jgi:hypothetical protein
MDFKSLKFKKHPTPISTVKKTRLHHYNEQEL